jgi:hypothetical protein
MTTLIKLERLFQASLFIDELSLTVTDDCCDVVTDMDEYVRITLDSVAFW